MSDLFYMQKVVYVVVCYKYFTMTFPPQEHG